MSANKTTTCTCLHTKWQSLFFSKSAACSSESFGVFQVSFSYQHQLPESLKPWRFHEVPSVQTSRWEGLWVGEVRMKRHRFDPPRKEVSPTPTPGRLGSVDRLTDSAATSGERSSDFIKICWKWSWISQCSLIQKKQTLSWQEFFQWNHPDVLSGRGSTICCHVLFKTIHAVMSQMAESRDYDMSVSGKPFQSWLIIGICWRIVSMNSVQ